jgi:hypothetical protein
VYPEGIALYTAPGRAIHLQKNVRLERFYEVVDVGVGTARFGDAEDAAAFYSFLKGDPPVATPKTDAPPLSLITAIPGVHFYYDYGRWHISLRSRQEEDRIVYVSRSAGVVRDDAIFRPLMACFTLAEERRRGLETWSSEVWAAGAKFIFPAIPPENTYISNLNFWGSTDFVPYAEATLAHSLGLVEAIDAEGAPAPGVRSVRLRGGTTIFVRRSTPLGLARSADGAWRLWLGDGEGWRPTSGPSDTLWKAVAPVCFGTPLDELTEWLPGTTPRGVVWEVSDTLDEANPLPAPGAGETNARELVIVIEMEGETMIVSEDGEVDYDIFEGATNWTIFTAA